MTASSQSRRMCDSATDNAGLLPLSLPPQALAASTSSEALGGRELALPGSPVGSPGNTRPSSPTAAEARRRHPGPALERQTRSADGLEPPENSLLDQLRTNFVADVDNPDQWELYTDVNLCAPRLWPLPQPLPAACAVRLVVHSYQLMPLWDRARALCLG